MGETGAKKEAENQRQKRDIRGWVKRHKSIAIPAVMIIILGALLLGQEVVTSWVHWTLRADNPHALLIPDAADAVVRIRMHRISQREKSNAINRWRTAATATKSGGIDVTTMISEWTGHTVDDATIGKWVGANATMFWSEGGAGVIVDARDEAAAQKWIASQPDGGWESWMTGGRVYLAENADTRKTVEATTETGSRTSISASSDFIRARNSHDMRGADIELFWRWRAENDEWTERIAAPLDCAKTGWVSGRARIDDDGIKVQATCPMPTRPRRPTPIDGDITWTGPGAADTTTVVTTFPTSWEQIRERAGSSSPGSGQLVEPLRAAIGDDVESERVLLEATRGQARIDINRKDGTWKVTAPLQNGKSRQAMDALAAMARAIGGRWG